MSDCWIWMLCIIHGGNISILKKRITKKWSKCNTLTFKQQMDTGSIEVQCQRITRQPLDRRFMADIITWKKSLWTTTIDSVFTPYNTLKSQFISG